MVLKSTCTLACFLCLAALSRASSDANDAYEGAHPITKVIKMLEGLKMKSIMEGKQEADAYAKFAYWCKESITTLKDAIAEEEEKISELEDLLAGKRKEKESLEEEIKDLEDQLAEMEASAKKAKEDRDKEEADYKKEMDTIDKTIQAVDGALQAMTSAEKATEPGMLQVRSHVQKLLALISVDASVTEAQVGTLQDFAKQRPKQLAKGDLDKHVDTYDFKSEGVVGLLKELKTKFEDEKLAATKAETNAANAYELAKAARDNAVTAAEKSKEKKEKTLGTVKATIADSEKALKNEEDDHKVDSKELADTKEECTIKKGEWDERSSVREQEIAAMDKAKEILSKASGVRTEAPGNPIPPASPVKFLQVASATSPKMSAVQVLRDAATKTHSRALERLAVEVSAHLSGPFDQVNNMIEKMIFRLMDEQKQEDEHKLWCDKELEKTNTMKDDKDDKIKELSAEIKTETAAVAKLTEEIAEAHEMMEKITSFKKEATEVREVGKKENKMAIDDAEAGQKALANAIAVLTDFYKESGMVKKEPWEFIQEPVKLPENPETWDSSYTGVADPKSQPSGIISVLEKVMSDFSKMEAETKSQEASDQKEYEQAMSDNDIEMARRSKETEMKSNEKQRRSDAITLLSSNKKDTAGELEKTEQYLKDLQPACVNGDSSYDDRKKARTTEIDALKKAQVILLDAFKEKATFLQIRKYKQIA